MQSCAMIRGADDVFHGSGSALCVMVGQKAQDQEKAQDQDLDFAHRHRRHCWSVRGCGLAKFRHCVACDIDRRRIIILNAGLI